MVKDHRDKVALAKLQIKNIHFFQSDMQLACSSAYLLAEKNIKVYIDQQCEFDNMIGLHLRKVMQYVQSQGICEYAYVYQ